jgi:uncharacterized membrane protein YraQ (UPF0718 family)
VRSSGDFARRHPWRQAFLTGASIAGGLTLANLILARPWDVIAFDIAVALVFTVLIGLLLPLASRPRRRRR